MRRAVMVGVSVLLASVSGVVTALVSAHPSTGLWVALGVVVVVGALLQAAITYSEGSERRGVRASGAGAVAIGGSAQGEIRTRVTGGGLERGPEGAENGVTASGPGAVSIGGQVAGPVSTDVAGTESGTS